MAATGKVIGTVTAVVGEAKATAADGTVRILQVGDQVHSDEVISTSAAGSINVALANGKTLDCGGDADLALHQGLLDVAVSAAPSADVDAIQRAIAAGQDPSQVAAATAAGGAPAAGGADEGGAHSPVIIEQSNSATVVSSGFSTEGDTIAFETPETELAGDQAEPNSAPVIVSVENNASSNAPVFEASDALQSNDNQPAAVVTLPAVVEAADQAPVTDDAPVIVVVETSEPASNEPSTPAEEPVFIVTAPESNDDAPASDEPIIVAQPNEPSDEQPSDEPIVVAQPNEPTDEETAGDDPVVVVVDEGDETSIELPSADVQVPEITLPESVSLSYSISANTNQDEQIGRLLFQNGDNEFQALVFFGQEGQQSPTSVELNFALTEEGSTVKLQYIDAFAGHDDAGTGKTATKIAIKEFGLGIDGVDTLLAEQNDGVNIGVGNKSIELEGTVQVDMLTG